MNKEWDSILEKGVFDLIDITDVPENVDIVPSQWVYKYAHAYPMPSLAFPLVRMRSYGSPRCPMMSRYSPEITLTWTTRTLSMRG